MSTLSIRALQAGEQEAAFDVYWRSLEESNSWMRPDQRHSRAQTREFFDKVVVKRCSTWVAERGGDIVGILAMLDGEVDRLYVDLPVQGQGVGSALLHHAKSLCPDGLRLVTLVSNTRACSFYERHGFVAYEYGTSPAPESEPDVWYRWPAP